LAAAGALRYSLGCRAAERPLPQEGRGAKGRGDGRQGRKQVQEQEDRLRHEHEPVTRSAAGAARPGATARRWGVWPGGPAPASGAGRTRRTTRTSCCVGGDDGGCGVCPSRCSGRLLDLALAVVRVAGRQVRKRRGVPPPRLGAEMGWQVGLEPWI
jgi:hypothetical protein